MLDVASLTRSKDWPLICDVSESLNSLNLRAYVVGGWIRDNLLGRDSHDVDFAVQGDGVDVASRVALYMGGTLVVLDVENRVGRVVVTGKDENRRTLDFSGYEGTIEDDMKRRDFTVDAVAIDLMSGLSDTQIVDPVGGLNDLANRVLRATTDTAFEDDPARLLRGIRLSALLKFAFDLRTESLIRRHAKLASSVSGERSREELLSLLSISGSGHFLSYMDEVGLLSALIPELDLMRGVEQPREHHWNILEHCLKTVDAFDSLIREGEWEYADALPYVEWSDQLAGYFNGKMSSISNRAALLRLASLLHDVAKPQTKTTEADGKVRFLGHPQLGADMAGEILTRLRFSNREKKLVQIVVKYHLRPTQMGWPELPSRRAVYRFCRDTGEAAVGVLFVSLADHMATRGPDLGLTGWRLHAAIASHVLAWREERQEPSVRLIDGYDIMNFFGLKPGQRLGQLLEAVREAQVSGEIATKEEALALVGHLLAELTAGRPETEEP